MGGGSWMQVFVRCPFYRRDDGQRKLVCEGIVDESHIQMVYGKKEDMRRQMEVFCCRGYEKCEIYRVLMEKYGEEE